MKITFDQVRRNHNGHITGEAAIERAMVSDIGARTVDPVEGSREALQQADETGLTEQLTGQRAKSNDDPFRRRVRNPMHGWIGKLVRHFRRDLTNEEAAHLSDKERYKRLEKILRADAETMSSRMHNTLDQMGMCYRFPRSRSDLFVSGKQSVRFTDCVMTPDEISFKVGMPLPRNVTIMNLMSKEVTTQLTASLERTVRADYTFKSGLWFRVARAEGAGGIPQRVKIQEMWDRFPESADGLAIGMGMTTNSTPIYKSFGRMYSMIVAGMIGSGKSVFLNSLLCTLIKRNSSDRLKLMLVDLKGGLEFSCYEGIPHLLSLPELPGGIAYYREEVPKMLEWLFNEGEKRQKLLKDAKARDIGRYNQHHRRDALPHIFLVIDEYGDIRQDKEIAAKAELRLMNICQRYRAVGIHVILCTQYPRSDVLSSSIKGVIPAKVAFAVPNDVASKIILDHGGASNLLGDGRMIFQWQGDIEIQGPYINDEMINDIVEGAKKGEFEEKHREHDVTELEIMQWALDNEEGWLGWRRLFAQFNPRGLSQNELLAWLKKWEEDPDGFVIGSTVFTVKKFAGAKGRRLVPMEDQNKGGNDAATQPPAPVPNP